jgi:hypothetical protein
VTASPSRRARLAARPFRPLAAAFAMLLAVSALAVAQPPAPVRAAPTDVVAVRLTIDAVDAINCFDETLGFGCGDADFYPVVHVNNGAEQVGSEVSDNNHPRPTDWQFDSGAIPYSAGAVVPITIDIYDADGGLRFDDDHADISPTDGTRQLAIGVTIGDVPCLVDLPTGAPDGTCGIDAHAWGFEGDEGADITFRVDVLNLSPDADGDGLADAWETSGVTFNGQFIDLPAMGADPAKPDLFIHLDWMQDATHDQRLGSTAIGKVVKAFAQSGYVSPTGSVGINLWVDQGPTSTRDFTTAATWGTLSRAQALPWQQNLGTGGGDFPYDWSQFQALKASSFIPTGRSPIFHYAIAAFFQEAPGLDDKGDPKPQNTSSGISRNPDGAGFADGASDFLITLGGFNGSVGTVQQQAGTLMHEFGHNLGLFHGGDENRNFKPNYPSIMNYFFQLGGLAVTNAGVLTQGVVDYSHGTLPAANEGSLDESTGLGSAAARFGTATRCPIAASSPQDYSSQWTNNANGAFAWNCDGDTTDGTISWDANGSGGIDGSLADHDDWSALKFRGGAIGDVGDGDLDLPKTSPGEPQVTIDTVPPTTSASLAGTLGQNGWYVSSVTVTLTAVDTGGSGVAYTEYRLGGGPWTPYAAPFAVTTESASNVVEFRSADNVGNLEQVRSVTIRIDDTPPTVACSVSPDRLWPPNHKLIPVTSSVVVTDTGSGAAGFTLLSAVSSQPDDGTGDGDTRGDISAWTIGAADTAGSLRAERSGGTVRVYTLTYQGSDVAGNTASCPAAVRVARD